MSIFDKCDDHPIARALQAAGVYPYFTPIQQATATRALIGGEWKIMLGANNYLGLTHHPRVHEAARAALHRYGSGSTGSRFLNGTLDLHEQLEQRFAALLRKESALVFTTGYQAGLGAIGAIAGRDDDLFMDRLDHASLVDAARLTLGRVHRYPHGDFAALDRQLASAPVDSGKLVVTDGVFSMEGSIVDLPELVTTAKRHDAAVLVDDAHALGVLGENGAGTARHFGLDDQVDLILATFSKSLASIGGVVAGAKRVIDYIRHHARPLMFSASMPPASVAGVLAALDIMVSEPERRERLWANTRRVTDGLRSLGYDIGASATPIIPVHIGDPMTAATFWRSLMDEGVFTHPILPPAVPPNSCRVRISMSAAHTDDEVDMVLGAFERVSRTIEALHD